MIQAILYEMLGSFGRGVLKFYFENQTIINIVFVIWGGFITYASFQLNKIRSMTVKMAAKAIKEFPNLSNEKIWEQVFPAWEEEVKKINPRFILNRFNLWIAPPTIENIIEVMQLSPEWFEAIRNGEVMRYRFALPGKKLRLKSFLDKE